MLDVWLDSSGGPLYLCSETEITWWSFDFILAVVILCSFDFFFEVRSPGDSLEFFL